MSTPACGTHSVECGIQLDSRSFVVNRHGTPFFATDSLTAPNQ